MKTVIKINSLIGTMVLVSSNNDAPEKVAAAVTKALNQVIKSSQESRAKNYSETKSLLQDLIENASRAIIAIDDNKPHWEICNIAVEEIEELTKQISSTILGNCASVINSNSDIVMYVFKLIWTFTKRVFC
ncbi:hypothetical protein SAMN05443549_103437 [Flavobacterium fluvii]|uniref:Uncharacterized protein n=1 Tax=Flavobacterium fluvii TaxID=468056 RepID=A0A1M5JBF9_9FLAO|nr:hypothetical protein [Flavobacterium fluvii]SHG37629.1 hypothetical protein SAMN05443549_103437 [Flavobacterium fluvii]